MMKIDDLSGIPEDKRRQVVGCLDDLLTFRDGQDRLSPVITGYNWYAKLARPDRVITFSNIHETEAYKSAMLRDLEGLDYDPQIILSYIRDKAGAFLWDPVYRIRDDKGDILQGLEIRDLRTGQHINLGDYIKPLSAYPQFSSSKGYLLAEDRGWELDMPFNNKGELMKLVDLFLRKSGLYVYDEEGIRLPETDEERTSRAPWTDAYRTPVLVLGKMALRYANELPQFDQATRMWLIENDNEISFIINKKLEFLKTLPHYGQLKRLGFNEERCLGNKAFLKEVDGIR